MHSLTNRRILLGVTGGIAAYKAAELIRRLKDQHADVRVVMTKAAQEFITPLTLQALSGNPVHHSLLDTEAEAAMGHIELAKWADLILIAPASADFIARCHSGMADDLLTTLCLASVAPIALAPAMNQAMWGDAKTQNNMQALEKSGMFVFGPGSGSQACGDIGLGRMLEATDIAARCAQLFHSEKLSGKHIVITAGPTREALDPVRYISNHSSGKMGFALASAAIDAGARVTLIAGPVNLVTPERVTRIDIISALDMHAASLKACEDADIFIASAAVADYRAADIAEQKIKKSGDEIQLTLVKNPDIVASIAALKNKPFCVGFAAETQNLEEYAKGKLQRKNLDMIIANDVANTAIGFNSDNNAVTVFTSQSQKEFPQCSKQLLAQQLLSHIHQAL
ncbi:MAG: bifunctional phosphopantothenoylcysteine decarboxylase/phosphopantothenate--cysteine ligase CoaBC [Pseudomonadales bacterium]|nr:bifunctional phosphopantothenoylcysteine decarboxylase/phosphopantothenate--cysteine ligase CoaBC [Pseudomonadales bacterium]